MEVPVLARIYFASWWPQIHKDFINILFLLSTKHVRIDIQSEVWLYQWISETESITYALGANSV